MHPWTVRKPLVVSKVRQQVGFSSKAALNKLRAYWHSLTCVVDKAPVTFCRDSGRLNDAASLVGRAAKDHYGTISLFTTIFDHLY